MGEKWQNLPFLGGTRTLVLVLKVGTGTHSTEGKWYRYQKLVVSVPIHSEGLVSVSIKVVPVPMNPTTLFFFCIPCTIKSRVHTPIVKEP